MKKREIRRKRLERQRRQQVRTYKIMILAVMLSLIFLLLLITGSKNNSKQQAQHEDAQAAADKPLNEYQQEERYEAQESAAGWYRLEAQREKYPFNTMSKDWDSDDLAGFTAYEIPQKYAGCGGELPEVVQVYTYCICKQKDIEYAVILAMIERESGYRWDAVSNAGAVGYMQIIEQYHTEELHRLGISNIKNPYQNIRTGIEIIKDLLDQYGTYEKALTAYNWGPTGAYNNFFSKGIDGCGYSEAVLLAADRIKEELVA